MNLRFGQPVAVAKARIDHLGLAEIGPVADDAIVDQRLPAQVVPERPGPIGGPVDHAAFAPPVAVGVDDQRHAIGAARQRSLGGERRVFGQPGADVALLDQHDANAALLERGDLLARRGEGLEVPAERPHTALRRRRLDGAEPLQVEHRTADRETFLAQARELALELAPVVEAVLAEPEAEHRLGRHRRMPGHFHVASPHVGERVPGDDVQPEIAAPDAQPEVLGREVPFLLVAVVEDQRERPRRVIEIGDREQRVAIGPAIEALHDVKTVPDEAGALHRRVTGRLKLLPQPDDMPRFRPQHHRGPILARLRLAQLEQPGVPLADREAAVLHRRRDRGHHRRLRQPDQPTPRREGVRVELRLRSLDVECGHPLAVRVDAERRTRLRGGLQQPRRDLPLGSGDRQCRAECRRIAEHLVADAPETLLEPGRQRGAQPEQRRAGELVARPGRQPADLRRRGGGGEEQRKNAGDEATELHPSTGERSAPIRKLNFAFKHRSSVAP